MIEERYDVVLDSPKKSKVPPKTETTYHNFTFNTKPDDLNDNQALNVILPRRDGAESIEFGNVNEGREGYAYSIAKNDKSDDGFVECILVFDVETNKYKLGKVLSQELTQQNTTRRSNTRVTSSNIIPQVSNVSSPSNSPESLIGLELPPPIQKSDSNTTASDAAIQESVSETTRDISMHESPETAENSDSSSDFLDEALDEALDSQHIGKSQLFLPPHTVEQNEQDEEDDEGFGDAFEEAFLPIAKQSSSSTTASGNQVLKPRSLATTFGHDSDSGSGSSSSEEDKD